jgi:solute carrier family 44 (choline transporter-like protein), member 2/4/5
MIFVGATAFTKADEIGGYMRHVRGYQVDGKICGQDGKFGAGLDYKYAVGVIMGPPTKPVLQKLCVKNCPKKTGEQMVARVENLETKKTEEIVATSYYKSNGNPKYTAYCVPYVNVTAATSSASAVLDSNFTDSATDYFQEMLYDVNDGMGAIWASLGFAVLFSFVFLIFVKLFAGITIFIAIFTGLFALAVVGYFFYFLSTCTIVDKATFDSCGDFTKYQIGTFQFGYIITWLLFAVLLCIVIFMRNRILLAVKLMKQAVSAINDMKMMLVTPIFMLLPIICVLVWWLYVCVAMASAGALTVTSNTTVHSVDTSKTIPTYTSYNTPVKSVTWDQTMYGLFFYHIFGLLWTMAFFIAAMNFTLSSATSQWYFAETNNGVTDLGTPVFTGVQRAFGIHGGTYFIIIIIIIIIAFIV